jgi:hypothetical protein
MSRKLSLGAFFNGVVSKNEVTFLDRDIITPVKTFDTKFVVIEKKHFNSLHEGTHVSTFIRDMFNVLLKQTELCHNRKEKSSWFINRIIAQQICEGDFSEVKQRRDIYNVGWIIFPLELCENSCVACIINVGNSIVQFFSTEPNEFSSSFEPYFNKIMRWLSFEAERNSYQLDMTQWKYHVVTQIAIDFKTLSEDVGVYLLFVNYLTMFGEPVPQIDLNILKGFRKFIAVCISKGQIFEFFEPKDVEENTQEVAVEATNLMHFFSHANK